MHSEICPHCGGLGEFETGKPVKTSEGFTIHSYTQCIDCNGTGKLDWVERVLGKIPRYYIPEGLITQYPNNKDIPNGWSLCDGNEINCDMKDLFKDE